MKIFKPGLQQNTFTKTNNQQKLMAASFVQETISATKDRFETGKIRIVKSFNHENSYENVVLGQERIDKANTTLNDYTDSIHRPALHAPAQMCFLYVGSDEVLIQHFNNHFECGYSENDLQKAFNFIHHLYLHNNKLPDIIFIDVPLDVEGLKQFCFKLKCNIILSNLPIIYNERQLTATQIKKLSHFHLIDDIIAIGSNKIDYFSKVMFLKQCKLHNQFFQLQDQIKKKAAYTISLTFFVKRLTDVLLSLSGIILLSPVFLLIATIISFESKGPVFYTSLRAGRGFKVFKFYKFRSMVVNADKRMETLSQLNQYEVADSGPKFFKINNDPRVTKFGKFLRNTSVDELPQLLNVLIGDMSIVGNRPLPIYEAVTLTTNEFVERFSAPAGITGLWQVNKRGKSDMSSQERIELDIIYSRNCNFYHDLKIMVKTPIALFQKSDV